ncbi:Crp/Fnr family transcriptional regulator [uncultured Limimaricola sp.]|uniref:Crp/Fnr family transcriptional regulator n=1 Tax=uncultured Limimaricola sp. TaxID=2211667 RepID=UPI0030FCC42B
MSTPCQVCPLRARRIFVELGQQEIRAIQRFKAGELRIGPGTPLLLEGSNSPQLYTALSGMGLRYKTLADGRRQVINFIFPGDFLGLQAGMMGEMQHSVEATTDMTLCVFDRNEFFRFFSTHPARAFDITWLAAVEEHFLGEALASLGQRSGLSRLAWAITRIYLRMQSLGQIDASGGFPLPYRQQDLADALGLSLVHTNKTLAKLRDRQLLSWNEGRMIIHDLRALADLAGTDLEAEVVRPLL